MKKHWTILLLLLVALDLTGCRKFLNEPSNQNNAPKNLKAYEDILNSADISQSFPHHMMYLTDELQANVTDLDNSPTANAYFWRSQLNRDTDSIPVIWGLLYRGIYKTNFIISNVMNSEDGTEVKKLEIRAEALTLRAIFYFDLLTVYAKAYNITSAVTDPGLPLVTDTAETDIMPQRSSVKETLEAMIADLMLAQTQLPAIANSRTRINKYVAMGMLARIYLYMHDYTQAELFAEKALVAPHTLVNYNEYFVGKPIPAYALDPQILWHREAEHVADMGTFYYDDGLISTFKLNDLRYRVFTVHDGYYHYSPLYTGYGTFGMTFPELYLIKAESLANNNKVNEAMAIINELRFNRILGNLPPLLSAKNKSIALTLIHNERRWELAFKGTRWMDMKRLDALGYMSEVNHIKFFSFTTIVATLLPKSPNYTWEIPARVLLLNPQMTKNF